MKAFHKDIQIALKHMKNVSAQPAHSGPILFLTKPRTTVKPWIHHLWVNTCEPLIAPPYRTKELEPDGNPDSFKSVGSVIQEVPVVKHLKIPPLTLGLGRQIWALPPVSLPVNSQIKTFLKSCCHSIFGFYVRQWSPCSVTKVLSYTHDKRSGN